MLWSPENKNQMKLIKVDSKTTLSNDCSTYLSLPFPQKVVAIKAMVAPQLETLQVPAPLKCSAAQAS